MAPANEFMRFKRQWCGVSIAESNGRVPIRCHAGEGAPRTWWIRRKLPFGPLCHFLLRLR